MIPHRSTLIDDDGALVLSTAQQMAAIAAHGFEYDYPAELLTHMAGGRIVAWETGASPGGYRIVVTPARHPPTAIKDELLFLPPAEE